MHSVPRKLENSKTWTELRTNCEWTWTDNYQDTGVKGRIVKSKASGNNNSIFLPAAGDFYGTSRNNASSGGDYWSSSLSDNSNSARSSYFRSNSHVNMHSDGRYYGRSVRPVCE